MGVVIASLNHSGNHAFRRIQCRDPRAGLEEEEQQRMFASFHR